MKRFYTALLLTSTTLMMMTIPGFGQDGDKNTLILQLPESHRWTADSFDEPDLWGTHYKGFTGNERYPSIDIQQSNMFHQDLGVSPQQIASHTTALIKTYDDTTEAQLRRQQEIDGDDCLFYTITTAETIILLFFRQSKTISHMVELELHNDQLKFLTLDMWEELFFSSLISE